MALTLHPRASRPSVPVDQGPLLILFDPSRVRLFFPSASFDKESSAHRPFPLASSQLARGRHHFSLSFSLHPGADDRLPLVPQLIDCVDRDTTKRTKSAIKLALRKGVPLSIPAGFRLLPESRWKQGSHDTALKNLVFHLTPVKDASGEVGSYIVIIA